MVTAERTYDVINPKLNVKKISETLDRTYEVRYLPTTNTNDSPIYFDGGIIILIFVVLMFLKKKVLNDGR